MSWKALERKGQNHFNQQEFKQARESWTEVALVLECESPDSLALANAYHNLGLVHEKLNDFDIAIIMHEKCLSIRERKEPQSLNLAGTYSELGVLYVNKRPVTGVDKAQRCLQKASEIQQKQAHDSLASATTYHNLGLICCKVGSVDARFGFFKTAIAIREQKAPTSLDLATSYFHIGNACNVKHDYDDAVLYFEKAIAIKERQGPHTLQLAKAYHNLGCVLTEQNRLDEARRCLEKAFSIQQKQLAQNSNDLTMTSHNLRRAIAKQNQLDKMGMGNEKDPMKLYQALANFYHQRPNDAVSKGKLFPKDDFFSTDVNHITELSGHAKNCIAEFLLADEVMHFAMSSKQIFNTLSLTYLPPGSIYDNPIEWVGGSHTGDAPRRYKRIPLLFPSRIRSVAVSLEWKDQGRGNRLGQIYIVAAPVQHQPTILSHDWTFEQQQQDLFGGGLVVYESPLAEHFYNVLKFSFCPMPDKAYYLWYKLGRGGGHKLTLRNFRLQTLILPALHEACVFGACDKVESMLKQGANPNAADGDGWTALHEATHNAHDAVVKMLLKHGAKPNAATKDGWTPLHEACAQGSALIVDVLLAKKAHSNATKMNGWTPLHEACQSGRDSIVALLLKHEGNPNAVDDDGWSPLHVACKNGHASIIKLLLRHGANPNAAAMNGWTPLHEVCRTGNAAVVVLLINHRARPNSETSDGWTPLHEASKKGVSSVVSTLLEHHANTNATNKDGLIPIQVAMSNRNISVVSLLSTAHDNDSGDSARNSSRTGVLETARTDIDGSRSWRLIEGISNWLTQRVKDLARALPQKITGLDKVLHYLMDRTVTTYTVYNGKRDAMNDNLVSEALASGISVELITHAVFACEESRIWLYNLLVQQRMSERLVMNILDVLHDGINADNGLNTATEALLMVAKFHLQDNCIEIAKGSSDESLNLSDYREVDHLYIEKEGSMTAYRHNSYAMQGTNSSVPTLLDGIYRIEGNKIKCAMVPSEGGIKYFLHHSVADSLPGLAKTGKGPHLAQEAVNNLIKLGCEQVLAWRLLKAVYVEHVVRDDKVFDKLIRGFKTVSKFRTQLQAAITRAKSEPLRKKLLGSKSDIVQSLSQNDTRFVVDRSLFTAAKTSCDEIHENEHLELFTTEFLEINSEKTHIDFFGKLIERAKTSGLKGRTEKAMSQFDARGVAVLAALNGGKVNHWLLPHYVQSQCCFQNDCTTKALCIPVSNLVLFATTDDLWIPEQVQHLENDTSNLNNWVALRAAFEFDADTGDFLHDSPGFERAEKLINTSVARFIQDTDRRFTEVYEASPSSVLVSNLRDVCDKVAARCGASPAWLLREMVSRYITAGAAISGPKENSSYGEMEFTIKQVSYCKAKVVEFDEKVNLEGILSSENLSKRICLREHSKRKKVSQVVLVDERIEVLVGKHICDVLPNADRALQTIWV